MIERTPRTWLVSFLVAAIAAALIYGLMPRPLAVDVVHVRRGPLTVTFAEEGKTRVKERHLVTSPVNGFARRIALEAGDRVRAGETVAVIEGAMSDALDPRSRAQLANRIQGLQAAVAAQENHLAAALAQAELARKEAARTARLAERGFVSAQVLERAQAEQARTQALLDAARRQLTVARSELATARAAARPWAGIPGREKVHVVAPIDGTILRVVREAEGPVAAGQPLLEIGDPGDLEVEVEVLTSQAVRIPEGARVVLRHWGGPPLEGRVRRVEPGAYTKVSALGVEEQRVRVIVDLISPKEHWAPLRDGFRIEARFFLRDLEDVLLAPATSLFRTDGGWAVWRVEDGRARKQPVEIGEQAEGLVEIKAGLSPGDAVIAHPDDRLAEGVRVRAR